MPTSRITLWIAVALTVASCSAPAPSADVDTDRILAADTEPGSWMTHGRTYGEQRFSPLQAISTANVDELGVAWSFELSTNRGASATPLVVDGVELRPRARRA